MKLGIFVLLLAVVHTSFSMTSSLFRTPKSCPGDKKFPFTSSTRLTTHSGLVCSAECSKRWDCLAFNFWDEEDTTVCELGQGTDQRAAGDCSKLNTNPGVVYMETVNQCINGGTWNNSANSCEQCVDGYTGQYCERLFTGCMEAKEAGYVSGQEQVIQVQVSPGLDPFDVLCASYYTVIERRGSTYRSISPEPLLFNKSWAEYKSGFGMPDFSAEFFLGLDHIHKITSAASSCDLYIRTYNPNNSGGRFNAWMIHSEDQSYAMEYTHFSENTAPALDAEFANNPTIQQFSTYDHGNYSDCAAITQSGWWFNSTCNGVNTHTPEQSGTVLTWPVDGIYQQFGSINLQLYCFK